MGKGSVDWKKLTARHKVIDKVSHYETGSGKLITWGSRDAAKAQAVLRNRAKRR